ncbi:MAG: SMI1/KNR4 family protein [Planctomycetes bacterium]|nr:SMI1/KNR4 family protein [Planctomycetota bacterium]
MPQITIGRKLKDFIISDGTDCGVEVPEARISEFERQHGVTIPMDLRSYFTDLNGTAGDYAYGIIRFWSLDEVQSVTKEISEKKTSSSLIQSAYADPIDGGDNFFVFADCMHEAQLYAIKLSLTETNNPVILLDGGEPIVVAESFSDFVERYLTTPEDLRLEVD